MVECLTPSIVSHLSSVLILNEFMCLAFDVVSKCDNVNSTILKIFFSETLNIYFLDSRGNAQLKSKLFDE